MTAVLTAFLEGKGKGRTLAVRMLLATNTVLLYKRSDEYRAARCSALCRAAWGRRASNTGQDKGQRKLLWHLNWMLLLRVSQTIRLSPCAAIYSLLDLTVVQLETNVWICALHFTFLYPFLVLSVWLFPVPLQVWTSHPPPPSPKTYPYNL